MSVSSHLNPEPERRLWILHGNMRHAVEWTDIKLGALAVFAAAQMALLKLLAPGGVPASNVADYYARRAEGEVGLIVSEGTVVNRPASSNDPNIPRFYGEQPLRGWKAVIDKVHAAGGVMATLGSGNGTRDVINLPNFAYA